MRAQTETFHWWNINSSVTSLIESDRLISEVSDIENNPETQSFITANLVTQISTK